MRPSKSTCLPCLPRHWKIRRLLPLIVSKCTLGPTISVMNQNSAGRSLQYASLVITLPTHCFKSILREARGESICSCTERGLRCRFLLSSPHKFKFKKYTRLIPEIKKINQTADSPCSPSPKFILTPYLHKEIMEVFIEFQIARIERIAQVHNPSALDVVVPHHHLFKGIRHSWNHHLVAEMSERRES